MSNRWNALGWIALGLSSLATSRSFAQISNFKHIIIAVQENRTPDNMFYALCLPPYGDLSSCSTTPSATQYNIQTSDWLDATSPTGVTQPLPVQLDVPYDLGHLHLSFVQQCNAANGKCKMDGAARVACTPKDACSGYAQPQYRYVDNSTGLLNPYLDMITQYGWSNYMFQTNQGPSYPAHQYLFSATSSRSANSDHSGIFASENGSGPFGNSGCMSTPDINVQLISPRGKEDPNRTVYPCFEHQTLADLLMNVGVSWRYYSISGQSIWTAPTSINHLCVPVKGKCTGPDWVNNVDMTPSDVLTDIANCKLKQVNWVIPDGQNSDHAAPGNTGGPAWIASIVNAIGNSYSNSGGACDYWGNNTGDATAIFVTWDDWGGWYDHEPATLLPFPQGGYQDGIRVPLLVVSAYTPVKYISNKTVDFGSIVRFAEHNFGIQEGALTFADARASNDLTDFFNLNQVPRVFVTIQAPKGAYDFIHDTSPPTDPDDY